MRPCSPTAQWNRERVCDEVGQVSAVMSELSGGGGGRVARADVEMSQSHRPARGGDVEGHIQVRAIVGHGHIADQRAVIDVVLSRARPQVSDKRTGTDGVIEHPSPVVANSQLNEGHIAKRPSCLLPAKFTALRGCGSLTEDRSGN